MTYTLTYDAENRLVGYAGGSITASFVYDGDGKRVQGTVNGVVTTYVGNHYEVQGTTTRKYYFAGTQRIAVRENSTLYFFLSDHLGSTAITVEDGDFHSELRYSAWGETREEIGETPTSRRFTGQAQEELLGIYFFEARWFDPQLGRFLSPDTLVPDPYNSLDWDRYAFVRGNPLHYSDPSGHSPCDGKYADPECQGVKINRRTNLPEPPTPTPTLAPKLPTATPMPTPTATPPFPSPQGFYFPPDVSGTNTPTPSQGLYPGPTNTPTPMVLLKSPEGVYIWVEWGSFINLSKVDVVDGIVDVAGIGGDILSNFGVPGRVIWGITEIPEGVGLALDLLDLGKGIVDIITENDPGGLSKTIAVQTFERTIVDGYRLAPNYGWVGNVVSLTMNLGPAININSIHIWY